MAFFGESHAQAWESAWVWVFCISASICHLGGPLGKPVGPFARSMFLKYSSDDSISSSRPSVAPQYLPNELYTPLCLSIQSQIPPSVTLWSSASLGCVYGLQALNHKPLHWSHPPSEQWLLVGRKQASFCMIRARNKWSRIRVQWCVLS